MTDGISIQGIDVTMHFEQYSPEDKDFDRVSDKLTAFTLGKGGPDYKPLSTAFKAISESGHVVGEAIATHLWGNVQVEMLVVDEGQRGQGIGKKLLKLCEKFAEVHNAMGLQLWTPSFQGEGFYERAGFKEAARFPLNVKGHFDDAPQDHIVYYKPVEMDVVKAAREEDYEAIAKFAMDYPEKVLAQLDEAAAANPKLGEALTPYFTTTKFITLDVEDIRIRLELKAIPKRIMRDFGAPSASPESSRSDVNAESNEGGFIPGKPTLAF